MIVEVFDAKKSRSITTLEDISPNDTVLSLKRRVAKQIEKGVERISLRLEAKGRSLRDDEVVSALGLSSTNAQLFLRDLGPQISWKTVFLCEYAGPLLVYPLFYLRPSIVYGVEARRPIEQVVTIALLCHSFHYAKRLFETQYIHRFSNATMPIRNLFKNCGYYWGFAAFMSYFINHPMYTRPTFSPMQVYLGLAGFIISEIGNFSIHLLLRNLRPAGTKERKIPYPNSNPLTLMYNFVSCPNYTYEVMSWISFTLMTQCLPVAFFTLAGFIQMRVWAIGKHRQYKKEFANYPKGRTPIIPFA